MRARHPGRAAHAHFVDNQFKFPGEALRRGAVCKVDLSEDYDVFGNKHRPLEEVRRELGIPPLEPVAKAS